MDARKNILLIRLKSMGDVVFTLPAVNAVRENFPPAKISFLVTKELAPIVQGFAAVDEIIPVDRAAFRSRNPLTVCATAIRLFRELRRRKFSLAVDFQGYGETAWLARLTGAPERWGSVYARSRRWAFTRCFDADFSQHVADWNVSLLRQCGLKIGAVRNEFVLPRAAREAGLRFFASQNLEAPAPTLFLQPFTSTPHKNWPLENFLALARHFHAQGVQIIFGGGPAERAALEPARAAGFPVSAGAPLLTTAAIMQLSTLAAGADTGLLHVAVAMGRRVVMLMHSNEAGSTHPFRHPEWAVTPPAGKPVSEIPAAAVIEACARAFREQGGKAPC